MKYKYKTKPFKHQHKAVKRLALRGHLGLLWEPGTGKTKAIVDAVGVLYTYRKVQRVLIVAPLSVVGVWQEEFDLHTPLTDYTVTIFDKSMASIPKVKGLHVVVVNYDLAWRRKLLFQKFKPDMVVADESHRIKKPSARRSKFMHSFANVPYRAILTGTPAPKSLKDLYSQWKFLNPDTFGTSVSRFERKHVIYGGFKNYEIRGYRNVGTLKKGIKRDALVRRKDQCLDLPPQVFQRVPVDLEPKARQQYETLAKEYYIQLEQGEEVDAPNIITMIGKLQQITGGFVFTDQGVRQISEAKKGVMRNILEDLFEQEQRVVVFARFIPEVDMLHQMGIDLGVETHVLRGGIQRRDRDLARKRFQSRPGPSLFVAQIQTGGLGITLHASHEVVFYSVTHALDDYIQACDRVHRQGQTHKVTYRHLVARKSIDLDIYAALRRKKAVENIVMGDPKTLIRRFV